MTEFIQGVGLLVFYRIFAVASGLAIVYLGFVLFRLGIFDHGGDMTAVWDKKSLALKRAAPGTFFALFGAALIAATVWRGLDFSSVHGRPSASSDPSSFAIQPLGPPKEIRGPLKAVIEGKQVSDEDRKRLSEWLGKMEVYENSIHYNASQPRKEPDGRS